MNIAKITWLKPEDGGRIPPPEGTRYTPIILVKGLKGVWSVDFICTELEGEQMSVEISFLSPNAPTEIFSKGVDFELYEGKKLVATGKIKY